MPLWLRKTTFNWLKEHYDKQNEEKNKNIPDNKEQNKLINIPDYVIKKAPKK